MEDAAEVLGHLTEAKIRLGRIRKAAGMFDNLLMRTTGAVAAEALAEVEAAEDLLRGNVQRVTPPKTEGFQSVRWAPGYHESMRRE